MAGRIMPSRPPVSTSDSWTRHYVTFTCKKGLCRVIEVRLLSWRQHAELSRGASLQGDIIIRGRQEGFVTGGVTGSQRALGGAASHQGVQVACRRWSR